MYPHSRDGLLVGQSIDGVETSFVWDSVQCVMGLGRHRGGAWGGVAVLATVGAPAVGVVALKALTGEMW